MQTNTKILAQKFEYIAPKTIDEALDLLEKYKDKNKISDINKIVTIRATPLLFFNTTTRIINIYKSITAKNARPNANLTTFFR